MRSTRFAVNCSIMLKDLPLAERLAVAKDAGFEAVELWWPFGTATPDDSSVDSLIATVRTSGLQLVGLNLFAGDLAAGDRGVVSWPGREAELRESTRIAARIGDELGCRAFNALYGNRQAEPSAAEQDALAVRNLREAAAELAKIGGTVLVEPVSGVDSYPLKTAADVAAVIDQVDADGVGLLLDVYHLAINGDDVAAAIERHRPLIAHVQIADAPGRGAPGTGELPLRDWIGDLADGGYDGWIGLEYLTDGDGDPFAWHRKGILA